MYKRIAIILLGLVMLLSCAQEQAVEEGDDLTLNTTIAVNDMPVVGPISLKQTQMISGNVMRSVFITGVNIGGEAQEISSVILINLDEGNIYFINDMDSNYSRMSLAGFDSLMAERSEMEDSMAVSPELTRKDVTRMEDEKKEIGDFGESVPVKFDLMLEGDTYQSEMTGTLFLSNSLKNAQVFNDFQKKSFAMFDNAMTANTSFFGLSGLFDIDGNWMQEINKALVGIPVEGDFKITVPSPEGDITFGIVMTLDDYVTTNIEEDLLKVPEGYQEVEFSDFRMY